jgi:C-terminal processing protease CtpA/Prc
MKAKCKCWHSCFGVHESQGTHADSSDHTELASQAPANGMYSEKLQETPVDKSQNDCSWGEPGIVYADDAVGLKVMGFKTGSSAASSGLKIDDVIVEVQDEMIMGLSSALAFEKMTGGHNTKVAVTVMRKDSKTGGAERVSAYVLRDVGSVRKVTKGTYIEQQPRPEVLIDQAVYWHSNM